MVICYYLLYVIDFEDMDWLWREVEVWCYKVGGRVIEKRLVEFIGKDIDLDKMEILRLKELCREVKIWYYESVG